MSISTIYSFAKSTSPLFTKLPAMKTKQRKLSSMPVTNKFAPGNLVIYSVLLLLFACGKDEEKPADEPTAPVVNKTCRLTNYRTTEDLGNGSQYAFSYDADLNLVQATSFSLQDVHKLTVKIGKTVV